MKTHALPPTTSPSAEVKPAPRLTQRTTAYDLLTKIRELIVEEPLRFDQGDWVRLHDQPSAFTPACGTVCCVAGWVEVLRSGPQEAYRQSHAVTKDGGNYEISIKAQRALGLTKSQAATLFDGSAIEKLANRIGKPRYLIQGTPEYAQLGAQHIKNFQRRHSARLKAKAVRPERVK